MKEKQYYILKDNNTNTQVLVLANQPEWREVSSVVFAYQGELSKWVLYNWELAHDLQRHFGGEIYEFDGELI